MTSDIDEAKSLIHLMKQHLEENYEPDLRLFTTPENYTFFLNEALKVKDQQKAPPQQKIPPPPRPAPQQASIPPKGIVENKPVTTLPKVEASEQAIKPVEQPKVEKSEPKTAGFTRQLPEKATPPAFDDLKALIVEKFPHVKHLVETPQKQHVEAEVIIQVTNEGDDLIAFFKNVVKTLALYKVAAKLVKGQLASRGKDVKLVIGASGDFTLPAPLDSSAKRQLWQAIKTHFPSL
jgi:hypothetical protein